MNKDTVAELHRLYERRQELQRQREEASNRNFWLGIFNDQMRGTGTRSSVASALGGTGQLADIVMIAVSNRFELLQQQIDKQITDLGGEA